MTISAHDISSAAKASKPRRKSTKRFHLLHVYGSVDPSVIGKPHKTYESLLKAARKFHDSPGYIECEDGLFYLVSQDRRVPQACSFTDSELEDEAIEKDGFCNRCMTEHLDGKCPHATQG